MQELLEKLMSEDMINASDISTAKKAILDGYDSLSDREKKRLDKYNVCECSICGDSIIAVDEKMAALENGRRCSGCAQSEL